ncbi:DUF6559 family protein [Colwellia sp. Bg11-12]|uniref:DUF6559 family protein n=1 Tax=Colwellia sp. Bg11-12 TaxID=2759817 RepID=UPI0015F57C74|nr:DUF6559 family protein [Colwellia sp. Bg11-12]MBA6264874.1 hypothetical protein [Colwellia sp. Bg11-12]
MFKYWSIKSYGTKLLPTLKRNFGCKEYYTASEVRTTVFQNNFSPKYLPLGYILFLNDISLKETMYIEFPQVNISEYRKDISNYLTSKSYHGYLQVLHH